MTTPTDDAADRRPAKEPKAVQCLDCGLQVYGDVLVLCSVPTCPLEKYGLRVYPSKYDDMKRERWA